MIFPKSFPFFYTEGLVFGKQQVFLEINYIVFHNL